MNSTNTIFVTSSTKKMYDFSGKKMLKSFIKHQKNNKLIYCTENFKLDIKHDNIIEYDIMNHDFLLKWLKKFEHIIPKQFGGKYDHTKDKHCRKKGLIPVKTKDWNYKASLWFRKVASLHYAVTNFNNYKYIIWIDCDCVLQNEIDEQFLKYLFNNTNMFYFLGKKRKSIDLGVESGFIGWNNSNNYLFLKKLFDFYMSGKFIKVKRWDDGYIIRHLLATNNIKTNDVAVKSHEINVMNTKKIKKIIIHNKGIHWRNNVDYKK